MSRLAYFLILSLAACGTDFRTSPDGGGTAAANSSLAAIRDEVFNGSCAFGSCHAGATPAAHLDLRDGDVCHALVGHSSCLFPDKLLVVPGKPEKSFLLDKLGGRQLGVSPSSDCADSNAQMPFGAPPLAPEKLAQIEAWIRDGAPCERSGDDPEMDAGTIDPGEPADVASLTADTPSIAAGEHTSLTLTLAHPAPSGGQTIDLDVDDSTVLGVPSALHVDGGLSSVNVDVVGKRPVRAVTITASVGASAHSVTLGVTGLLLSEIEFDPVSSDDGYEWIELANTTDVAIDLSSYSIGSGRTSYTYSLAQLAGTIPAHGCFVVGGPSSGTSNAGPQYDQTFNFSPDLVNGSGTNGQAAGFALFDAPITHVDPATAPLDAVLVGQANPAGLVDARGQLAAPNAHDVAAGHSVSRSTATAWVDQPSPTPNQCPLH